jgi:hypothetical protein
MSAEIDKAWATREAAIGEAKATCGAALGKAWANYDAACAEAEATYRSTINALETPQ